MEGEQIKYRIGTLVLVLVLVLVLTTYFVTLKTLRRRRALSPERPKDPARGLKLTQKTSKMDPKMTTQSNLLKAESK